MSLLYTEEQKALLALVREMAENEIKPHVKDADEKGECPRELFKWGFDMGLHMLEIPEEYGGTGLSYETTAMIFEELAKVDAGYAITFVTTCRLPRYLTKPRQRRSEWDMAGSDGISRVSAVFRGKSLLTNKMRII